MLDDHLYFLGDVVFMQAHPLVELDLGFFAFHRLVSAADFLRQVVGHFVIGVVLQHIKNKAFFYGLPHAVHMVGLGLIGFGWRFFRLWQAAKQFQCFGFWCGGKREITDVVGSAA